MLSLIGLLSTVHLSARFYPVYFVSAVSGDIWIYYVRVWLATALALTLRSIAFVRIAGGVGREDPTRAAEIIFDQFSANDTAGGGAGDHNYKDISDSDSLADLFAPQASSDDNVADTTESLLGVPEHVE